MLLAEGRLRASVKKDGRCSEWPSRRRGGERRVVVVVGHATVADLNKNEVFGIWIFF